MTHGTKRAEIDFTVFLTIFEYAESNAERCQAQLFMQRLEFYDSKLVSKIARKSLKTKVSACYEPVQDTYMLLCMWPTIWGVLKKIYNVFNYFRVCRIWCRAMLSSNIYEKTRILRFKGVFDRKSLSNKEPATCLRNKVHNMAVSYVTHSTKRVKK